MQSFSKTATIDFEDEQKRAASACFLGGGLRTCLDRNPDPFFGMFNRCRRGSHRLACRRPATRLLSATIREQAKGLTHTRVQGKMIVSAHGAKVDRRGRSKESLMPIDTETVGDPCTFKPLGVFL
jgi:hypothetical protein